MRVRLTLTEQQSTDMYVALRLAAWQAGRVPSGDALSDAEQERFRNTCLQLADLTMDAKVAAARSPYRKGAR